MNKLHNAVFFLCVLTHLAPYSLEDHFAGSKGLYLSIVICIHMCIATSHPIKVGHVSD